MSAQPVYVTVALTPMLCTECGVHFALDESVRAALSKSHETFYCPHGHSRWYPPGGTETEQLKRKVADQDALIELLRDERDREERKREVAQQRARAYRGHLTRVKKRVGNGVCPCCKRSFENLLRHMKGEHPAYGAPPAAAAT